MAMSTPVLVDRCSTARCPGRTRSRTGGGRRAGLDLNPLDVTDTADITWLDALIWPERSYSRDRLRAAVAIAVADPPLLVRGDAGADLAALAARAPNRTGCQGHDHRHCLRIKRSRTGAIITDGP